MLTKTTQVYAHHSISLECDIYTDDQGTHDDLAVLYFHPGGLVDWGRECLPPWLVQVCYQRKWLLISASYRLLPQASAHDIFTDAAAALRFASKWNVREVKERRVIIAGASAGFLITSLLAHHVPSPRPLALLSICGITTFRHPFFTSSTLLTPRPIPDTAMAPFLTGPVVVGVNSPDSESTFVLAKLLPNGRKNPAWKAPVRAPQPEFHRGSLYEYYTHRNEWGRLLGGLDIGYEWASDPAFEARLRDWPPTVILHGDADVEVPVDGCFEMQKNLGEDRVKVCIAEGQPHLFEGTRFIEDEGPEMDVVRKAVARLDEVVASSTSLSS